MKLTTDEIKILNALRGCRFFAGSFPKKLSRDLKPDDVSPLQQWYLHKFATMYRKQIGNLALLLVSENFLRQYPEPPPRRRDAERALKKASKSKDVPPSAIQLTI